MSLDSSTSITLRAPSDARPFAAGRGPGDLQLPIGRGRVGPFDQRLGQRRVLAERGGWLAYAFAALGLLLGVWLLADQQSWRLWTGPLPLGVWAPSVSRWT